MPIRWFDGLGDINRFDILRRLKINQDGNLEVDGQPQVGGGILVFNSVDDFKMNYPNGLNIPVWITSTQSWYYWNNNITDTTPPIISISPASGIYTGSQQITLSSNETASIYYTLDGSTPTTSSTKYTAPFTVSANTTVKYLGFDSTGNQSTVQSATYTINQSDTTAPNPVTNLVAGTTTNTSIPVTWTLSSSTDVANYEVAYSTDGTNFTVASNAINSSSTSYAVSGLTANTNYTIRVVAIDGSGNRSTSVTVTALTAVPSDTTPPNDVTNLATSNVTDTSLTLSWAASTSTDIANYDVYEDSTLLGNTTSTTYNVTGLTASTSYTFKVVSKDTSGNISTGVTLTQITNAPVIHVTDVTLDKTTASIDQNTTLQLNATVSPNNAADQSVSWSSSNTNIVTVDSNGIVTGIGVGSAVITVTTNDGGFEATCNISVTQTISGFDYNNLVAYPDNTTITLDQTVTAGTGGGAGDWVHPTVRYFANGWNGHNYWMSINPYPDTQSGYEDPFFFYSDDGDNWHTPTGASQPIFPTANGVSYNSDAHIFIDYDGVTMHYLNRAVYSDTTIPTTSPSGTASFIEIVSSTDGVNWTGRQVIFDTKVAGYDLLAPSVCKYNGKYYMFAQDIADQNHITILEATTVRGTWTEINRISTGTLGALWHAEVQYINGEFVVIASTGASQGGSLMLGKFTDVMDTTVIGRNNYIVNPPNTDPTTNNACYKSSLLYKDDNNIEIYVGFKGQQLSANTNWRVTRTPANRLVQTLDLSGFTDVTNYVDNSTQKTYSAEYFKMAVDFTIKNVTSTFITSAYQTLNHFNLHIENGALKAQVWNHGEVWKKLVSYGLSVGDRITIISDDVGEIYINGRLVASVDTLSANIGWDNGIYGSDFGDKDVTNSMSDIKLYLKPAYIHSTQKALDYKTQLLNEYATNPTNFLLVDEFNRVNGALTTSDNGVTYTLVGTPQISNNQYAPTNTSFVLVPYVDGDFSMILDITSSLSYGIDLYLQYQDSNNYVRLKARDANHLILQKCTAGTITDITTGGTLSNINKPYNYIRFDFIGTKINVYRNGVFDGFYTRPSNVFTNMFGFATEYGTGAFDYIIIKKLS